MSAGPLIPATAELADAMAALHAEGFPESWTASALEGLVTSPGVHGLLATDGQGRVAFGFGLVRVAADEAEILTLAVSPGHRRRGVGRTLLEALLCLAERSGARNAFLEVAVDNPAAQRLYTAAGFAQAGRRQGYYARPTGTADALILRRSLAAPGGP